MRVDSDKLDGEGAQVEDRPRREKKREMRRNEVRVEVRGTGRKMIKGTHGGDRVKGAFEAGQGHRTGEETPERRERQVR